MYALFHSAAQCFESLSSLQAPTVLTFLIQSTISSTEPYLLLQSYNEKAEDFYMPVWSLEEIVKLRNECYPHRSESDVLELYACWGGIVRWVLERPNTAEWRRKLHQVANAMDNDKLEKACCAGDDDEVYHL